MQQEYAIGWGALALVNGAIARVMHPDPLTWSIFSMVAGPVVTFGLLILGPPEIETKKKPKDRPYSDRGKEGFPL